MRSDVMSVDAAAEALGVSPVRVRQLARNGALASERVGRSILLSTSAVQFRAANTPRAGRPFGPDMAWALLRCLDLAADGDVARPAVHALIRGMLDRRVGHRAKIIVSAPRDAADWARLLSPRARQHRFWIHQGVRIDLLDDKHVNPARARAAAAHGIAISAAGDACAYVAEQNLPGLMSKFQLEPDEHGNLSLYVVAERASHWLPAPGEPIGAAAAAVDMFESDDTRMRHAGEQWLARNGNRLAHKA